MRESSWFLGAANPTAAVRLVLFPHAGGTASAYQPWMRRQGPQLEVHAVQYPGRETRLDEPPYRSVPALAAGAARALSRLPELPTVFLGHSMGGLIAFESVRILARDGAPAPRHLIVSACAAPHVRRDVPDPDLSDEALATWLLRLGGTDPEVLADPELRELVLPPVSADLAALRDYRPAPGKPLECPITVLTGTDDARIDVGGWRRHTSRDIDHREYPGGHHFLGAMLGEVMDLVHELAQDSILPS